MYEKIKSYINRYDWAFHLILACIACAICWIIYGGPSDNSSATDHLERAKDQQRNSLELNQTVTDSVERSTQLNQRASDRMIRAQEYQQRASKRVKEGTSRLDEAEALLTRNAELIERVEQGHQAQSPNGRATTPPTKHVGGD